MAIGRAETANPRTWVWSLLPAIARDIIARLEQERGRWFLWAPVCFAAGILGYFSLPHEPPLGLTFVPAIIALALTRLLTANMTVHVSSIVLLLVGLGFGAAKLRETLVSAPVLDRKLYRAEVTGFVEYVEPRTSRGPRVTLRVIAIKNVAPDRQPVRVRIRFLGRTTDIWPGDAIRVAATLAPPAAPALPGGYDFARAAYFKSIGGVGYARGPPKRLEPAPVAPLLLRTPAVLQRLRQVLGERVTAALPGQAGAIANALMTGERGRITQTTLDAYRDSGLLHILSISGLHMAIMGGSVFFALRLLLAAWPSVALRFPIKKWAAVGAMVAALSYLLISGATYATIRAFVMIAIMMLAIVIDRPAIALRNVALAALVILVLMPESVLHVGFQMSFAAVVALVASYEAVRDQRRNSERGVPRGIFIIAVWFFMGIIGSTIIASLAVAPFAAFHFHKSQQYAVLANLIAVPACNLVVMPAALASYIAMPFGLEWAPLWLMGRGIDLMTRTATHVAELPGAVGRIPAFSSFAFGLMVFGGIWLCLWRTSWRLAGLLFVTLGIAIAPIRERPVALVGRDGHLVAVRQSDGRLAALTSRRAKFELTRWLEHDGDPRNARQATDRRAYRCDQVGCTAKISNTLVAISKRPASLRDDCLRAGLLVLTHPKPAACLPRGLVIDYWAMREKGTHAIYLSANGKPRVQTVAGERGIRPWTDTLSKSARHRKPGAEGKRAGQRAKLGIATNANSRLRAFSAPRGLQDAWPGITRPEIEEDGPEFWAD